VNVCKEETVNHNKLCQRIGVFTLAAALVTSSAHAQKGPKIPPGGGEEDAFGNNLSVPTVFIPDSSTLPLRVGCPPAADPTGPQSTVYLGFWLQKTEATWTADCVQFGVPESAHSVPVAADWGDNLTTRPNLPAGKPVRVEVSLVDHSDDAHVPSYPGLQGFVVTNLTPELEDRLATYGTDGTTFLTAAPGAPFTRYFDEGARLKIEKLDDVTGQPISPAIFDGPMTAEINSIGAVVYGFNWGSKGKKNTPAAGKYKLTFTANYTNIVDITDKAAANVPIIEGGGVATSIIVTLTSSHGGQGGQGGRP